MRRFLLVLAVGVGIAACGGSEDAAGMATSGTVTSNSSIASVTIAAGSLPDGVTLADIQVEAITDLGDDRLPLVLVGLLPHGLQLSEPAIVSINLAGELPTGFTVVHQSDGDIEFLHPDVEFTDDGAVVSVSLSSFSFVSLNDVDADGTITLVPATVEKGQDQTFSAFFDFSGVDEVFATSPGGITRFVRLGPPVDLEEPDSEVAWRFGFTPRYSNVSVISSGTSYQTQPVSAECYIATDSTVVFDSHMIYDAEVLEIGEPIAAGLVDLSHFFDREEEAPAVAEEFPTDVRSTVVGDTLHVSVTLLLETGTLCVEPLSAGGTSTSSTTPGGDDDADLLELDRAPVYDCPPGHQPDTAWNAPTDGKGNVLDGEPESKTDLDKASDIGCTQVYWGSYVFVMTVKGDGESLSKQDLTTYGVRFIVNNEWPDNVYYDDTGFEVYVSWQHLAQAYAWQIFDSDRSLVKGASVDIEWLDESTLQVTVDFPSERVDVTEVRTELDVYISDVDDNHVYDHRDVAIWTAEQ